MGTQGTRRWGIMTYCTDCKTDCKTEDECVCCRDIRAEQEQDMPAWRESVWREDALPVVDIWPAQ